MALLTQQQVVIAGLQPVYSAVNASDTITPDEDLFLHVKNANAGTCTVTLTDNSKTPGGSSATNPTVSVPATTGDRMIGPIPAVFQSTSTGLITVAYSVTSSVTAALLRM
jgi:uncharacterized membrane protein